MRFWTSDWHINSEIVKKTSHRPFKSVDEMNESILRSANKVLSENDVLVHVGDLIQSGKDRGTGIPKDRQLSFKTINKRLKGKLICIEGNHDPNNNVFSIASSMATNVGNYKVTVGHYPTFSRLSLETKQHFISGKKFLFWKVIKPSVHICGHVHGAWQVKYDAKKGILNINVGIDANGYKILSDYYLCHLIDMAYDWWKEGMHLSFKEWKKKKQKEKHFSESKKRKKMLDWLRVNKPDVYASKMRKHI